MAILLIETSTEVCSVALAVDDKVITQLIQKEEAQHSALIGIFAEKVLEYIPKGKELQAVAVSEGPGSYTGLRIGASFAKALCMIRQIPMVAITTPRLLVDALLLTLNERNEDYLDERTLVMPMIDARRMEVYTALYDLKGNLVSDVEALILTDTDAMKRLQNVIGDRPITYLGSGAKKAQEIMSSTFATSSFVPDVLPQAAALLPAALEALNAKQYCDVAYWVPFYLKEYEAKMSINKVLGEVRT